MCHIPAASVPQLRFIYTDRRQKRFFLLSLSFLNVNKAPISKVFDVNIKFDSLSNHPYSDVAFALVSV